MRKGTIIGGKVALFKPLEYTILQVHDATTLENNVNHHLKNGWELKGGVCVTSWMEPQPHDLPPVAYRIYAQAMVRRSR